jgi:hypothetical protein
VRSYIRHPSDIPIEYQMDETGSRVSEERLSNISSGGLSFSCASALPEGCCITIRMASIEPAFAARAQVVWCRRDGEGYAVGVAFIEADALFRARMLEQVCHIEHYKAEVLAQEGRQLDGEQAACEWIQKYAGSFPKLGE